MNADEIRAWLAARYDEDERVAQDAGGRNWGREAYGCVVDAADNGLIVYSEGTPSGEQADHIARHDPARELRAAAAKRRRLERHRPVEVWAGHDHIPPGQPGARRLLWLECAYCIEDTSNDEGAAYDCRHGNRRWPCQDIVDDAQSYAEHPDFPEELRLP